MLMSVFIIISLLVVFSFEEMGLFRKELNINSEVLHIGKIQQTLTKKIKENNVENNELEQIVISKVNSESQKIKEKTQEKMMNILIDGIDDD